MVSVTSIVPSGSTRITASKRSDDQRPCATARSAVAASSAEQKHQAAHGSVSTVGTARSASSSRPKNSAAAGSRAAPRGGWPGTGRRQLKSRTTAFVVAARVLEMVLDLHECPLERGEARRALRSDTPRPRRRSGAIASRAGSPLERAAVRRLEARFRAATSARAFERSVPRVSFTDEPRRG